MGRRLKPRKCRLCGREFLPEKTSDKYCPGVCSLTAGLIRQPVVKKPSTSTESWESKVERFPRVAKMFSLPMSQRWELAKTFTPEEQEFAKKWARKDQAIENMVDYLQGGVYSSFDDDEDGDSKNFDCNSLGDSDDGTI